MPIVLKSYRLLQMQTPVDGDKVAKVFFSWNIQVKNKMQKFYMWGILLGIVVICLFPVWPLWIKKGIFYLSLWLLILIVI